MKILTIILIIAFTWLSSCTEQNVNNKESLNGITSESIFLEESIFESEDAGKEESATESEYGSEEESTTESEDDSEEESVTESESTSEEESVSESIFESEESSGESSSENEESSDESSSESQEESIEQVLDAKDAFLTCVENINNADSFYAISSGTAVSLGITQYISTRRYVIGERVFKESISCSRFVKVANQTFIANGKYFLRKSEKVKAVDSVTWADTASEISREDYLSSFGSVPNGFNNYIINEQTIISVEMIKTDGGYQFKVVLDNELSTANIKKEMKFNSGSSDYPSFEEVTFTVTADENFNVKSVRYQSVYCVKIAFLGNVKCQEDMTETFYDINKTTTFPEQSFFNQYV